MDPSFPHHHGGSSSSSHPHSSSFGGGGGHSGQGYHNGGGGGSGGHHGHHGGMHETSASGQSVLERIKAAGNVVDMDDPVVKAAALATATAAAGSKEDHPSGRMTIPADHPGCLVGWMAQIPQITCPDQARIPPTTPDQEVTLPLILKTHRPGKATRPRPRLTRG
jgi:hypothetical protein